MPKTSKQTDPSRQAEPLRVRLPLVEPWLPGLDQHPDKRPRDPACARCALGAEARHKCLPGTGEPGSVLVVYGQPTLAEDESGASFSGRMASYVIEQARATTDHLMPMRACYAVACHGTGDDTAVAACRPYLAHEIAETDPVGIVAVGALAAQALVGHALDAHRVRRAWAWVAGRPVAFVGDPQPGTFNRFMRKRFEQDLRWAVQAGGTLSPPAGVVQVLTTGAELEQYLDGLTREPVVVDVEHEGHLWRPEFKLLCVGLCQDPARPIVATMDAVQEAHAAFADFLGDLRVPKVGQNIKHDRQALWLALGADMRGIEADTMLWSRLREPEAPAGLGQLAWTVGLGGYKEAAHHLAEDDEGDTKKDFGRIPKNDLHVYNGRDTAATLLVYRWQKPRMGALARTWESLIGPAFDALAIVERNGMLLSGDAVRAYDAWLKARQGQLEQQMRAYPEVPADFNVGSAQQKAALLFDVLKLVPKSAKRTKAGARSVAAGILEEMADQHPVIPVLLELAKVRKQLSTYGLSMLEHASPVDGRVHTTFKLVRTGRLSSSGPNMQNITRPEKPGDEGEWARGCFVAPKGQVLVQLDFSQLELRIAAMLSGDRAMAQAFEQGADFHTTTAAKMFAVPVDKVTKQQRSAAKCFHPDTEVLTRTGWRRIVDLMAGEEVMQAVPGLDYSVRLEWAKPLEVFTMEHPSRELVHLYSEGMDLRVTPDHRMLGWRASGTFADYLPETLQGARGWANAGQYAGDTLALDPQLLRLAVATQADGSITDDGAIRFGFTKLRKVRRMRQLLRGIAHTKGIGSNGVYWFRVLAREAPRILALLEGKRFPWDWLRLTPELRNLVLEEAKHWDSCQMSGWRMYRYSTVERQNAEVLQALAALDGKKTRLVSTQASRNAQRRYDLTVRDRAWSRTGALATRRQSYTGKVACLSVPSTYVLVRDGGVPVICGQTINFGLLYGKTAYALSKDLDVSVEKAEEFVKKLFGAYPRLADWRTRQQRNVQLTGEVWSVWNPEGSGLDWVFRRSAVEVGDAGDSKEAQRKKQHQLNISLNTPVQCIANCFSLASLTEAVRWTQEEAPEVTVIMTVHDSIVLEAPEAMAADVARHVMAIMTRWPSGPVKLAADAEVGTDWGHMTKLKLAP